MKRLSPSCRAIAALFFTPVSASFAYQAAPAPIQPMAVGSTGPATSAPHVPVPRSTPCVVELFQGQSLMEQGQGMPESGTHYTYAPPAGCRGPWAKVVLKVAVDEDGFTDAAKAYIRLGGIKIFEGSLSGIAPGTPSSPSEPGWEAERDVTDLASLLANPHNGQVGLKPEQAIWQNNMTNQGATLSAQLLFYRASYATPAQKTPDAVFRVMPQADTVTLPHNIVRAYLDVYNQEPWWFTCVPAQELNRGWPFLSELAPGGAGKIGIYEPYQGCGGGSFAEIQVRIDGTPAGVAPVFPLLSSSLDYRFTNMVNAPTQPPQMLDYMPYRVDLTPFAAILNEAGEHTIALSRPASAYLLVYQDKRSTRVSGAVTLNTLAGSPGSPVVSDTLEQAGDTVSGQVATGLDRNFKITGFVNTSHGRVTSSVHQRSHFQNTQTFYLDGLQFPDYRHYRQHLQLSSWTLEHSRRTRGGTVLDNNLLTASYPLTWQYDMDGYTIDDNPDDTEAIPSKGTVSVEQHRNLDASYDHHGHRRYTSGVRERFDSSRTFDMQAAQNSNWQSTARYHFYDNRGSCYRTALTALDGVVTGETRGLGCPDGHNQVRWFAHSDGSPDSLGWMH